MAELRDLGFGRDGLALLPGFVGPAELGALRDDVEAALARPLPAGCERPHNTLPPLRWDDPVVVRVLDCERRVAALAQAVGATDLRWISGYVSVKQGRSGPRWWHQVFARMPRDLPLNRAAPAGFEVVGA